MTTTPYRMLLLQLLIKHKNITASFCTRYGYGALFSGSPSHSQAKKRSLGHYQTLKKKHFPLTIGHMLDISYQNIVPDSNCCYYCSHSASHEIHKSKRKLLENVSYSSGMLYIHREMSEDAYKKTALIDKINEAMGLSNSSHVESASLPRSSRDRIAPGKDGKDTTLEKRIMHHMEFWEIDEAIDLLHDSVVNGVKPDRTVIFNMLRQIADLGKIECLLDLYDNVWKDNGLVSSERFYQCLGLAIFSSGQLTEGMDILLRKYEAGMISTDVDILFTILGTTIIREFEDHFHLVQGFVDTILARDPPLLPPRALLWKCFVLAGKFDKADELRSEHEELKKQVALQVTSIVQSSAASSHIEFDRETVLLWLIQQDYLKQGLRASALHILIQLKCDDLDWTQAIKYLSIATENGVKPQQETMVNFLTHFFDECSDEEELAFWKSVGDHLENREIKLDSDVNKAD